MTRLATLLGSALLLGVPAAGQEQVAAPAAMAEGGREAPVEAPAETAPVADALEAADALDELAPDGAGAEVATVEETDPAGAGPEVAAAETGDPVDTPAAGEEEPVGTEEAALAPEEPAREPLPPAEFGLGAVLGVEMGMPLDRAVAVLLERGFVPQAEEATRAIEASGESGSDVVLSATGSPLDGLVVTSAIVPTPWGNREVPTEASVFLGRRTDGVAVRVELSAESAGDLGDSAGGYGSGRVFALEVYHDYGDLEEPVGWLQIEAQLREAAMAPPTCESVEDRISMIWVLEGGMARGAMDDHEACSDPVYADIAAVSPGEVIARTLADPAADPVALASPGSLLVQISPDPTEGWVWIQRTDAALKAEVIAGAVRRALDQPPVPVTAIEF